MMCLALHKVSNWESCAHGEAGAAPAMLPSNVLLAEDGPRVIDFGISRAAESTALTQAGLVIGSPGYMSPEQAMGYQRELEKHSPPSPSTLRPASRSGDCSPMYWPKQADRMEIARRPVTWLPGDQPAPARGSRGADRRPARAPAVVRILGEALPRVARLGRRPRLRSLRGERGPGSGDQLRHDIFLIHQRRRNARRYRVAAATYGRSRASIRQPRGGIGAVDHRRQLAEQKQLPAQSVNQALGECRVAAARPVQDSADKVLVGRGTRGQGEDGERRWGGPDRDAGPRAGPAACSFG